MNYSKLRTAFIVNLVFCVFIVSFTVYLSHNNETSFFNCLSDQQESLAAEVARQMQDNMLSADLLQTDREIYAIKNTLKKTDVSNSRFWIFGTKDVILFVKDDWTTKMYENSPISFLLDDYSKRGGKNIEQVQDLIDSKGSGSVEYSRSGNAGEEILSVNFFQVDGEDYYIGVSTTKQFYFSLTDFYRDRIYLYALAGLLCSVIFVTMIYFLLKVQNKDTKLAELNEIVRMKNSQVDILNKQLTQRTTFETKKDDIYDPVTKLYSKQFFFAMLDNAYKKSVFPTSTIIIHLRDSEGNLDQNALREAADVLKSFSQEKMIFARIDYNQFGIVLLNANLKMAYEFASVVENKILEGLDQISVEIKVQDIRNLMNE